MAKKHIRESMAVMWTFEQSEAGLGWAVFIHSGGVSTRLSPWAPTAQDLAEALKGITGLNPTGTPMPSVPEDGAPDAPA